MDVTTSNTVTQQQSLTTSSSQSSDSNSVLSSDFETFLQMLTTQAKYQDPLEPIDSSEYAAQLAQFSMVEQQVQSNELLTLLTSQLGGDSMAGMASWIGMEARTTTPVFFDGTPVTVTPKVPAGTDKMFLTVHDASGRQVQRQSISVSNNPIQWTGIGNDGVALEAGNYTLAIEAQGNGEVLSATPVEHYARVTEVRKESGTNVLVFPGGQTVPAAEVTALREIS